MELGPDQEDMRQVKVPNRMLTWTKKGVEYEADPRHAEIVIESLGLTDAKPLKLPGIKDATRRNISVEEQEAERRKWPNNF